MGRRMAIVAGVVVVGLVMWFAASAVAGSDDETSSKATRTIMVTSTATVKNAPDEAVIGLGVTTEAPETGEAFRLNGERMGSVLDALKAAGVAKDDIETANVSLEQRTRDRGKRTVYVARNEIRVTIHDLSSVGAVIDAAVAAGANEVRDIRFQLSDEARAKTEALQQAVRGARQKADAIAGAAGVQVTGVQSIREEGPRYDGFYRYPAADLAYAEGATTPVVPPSEIETKVTVTAVFRIG